LCNSQKKAIEVYLGALEKNMKKTITRRPKKMTVSIEPESAYNKDLNKWALKQTKLLKEKDFSHLDLVNLIEEVEDFSGSLRRALKSHLIRLLMNLLKQKYQSRKQENSNSWRHSIIHSRREIKLLLDESPSLKPFLKKEVALCYLLACKDASFETGIPLITFDKECPWTLDQALENDEILPTKNKKNS
jgi:hypothetical protein